MYTGLKSCQLTTEDLKLDGYCFYENDKVKRNLGSDRDRIYQGSVCTDFFEVWKQRDGYNSVSLRGWTIGLEKLKCLYTLPIPKKKIALVIGRAGATIKELEKLPGAKINLDAKNLFMTVVGSEESIKLVLQEVGKKIGKNVEKSGVYGTDDCDLRHGCNHTKCILRGALVQNEVEYQGVQPFVTFTQEGPKNVLALDCEMVTTTNGQEIVEIAVVDDNESVVYSTKVAPSHSVVDFRTKYSGFKPEDLEGVTKSLMDVQEELKTFLNKNTIIVGHALQNDLRALHIVHDNIVDTNDELKGLFPRPPGRSYGLSLSNLYKEHVGSDLYSHGEPHMASRDAKACLQILKKKLF